MMNHYQEGGLTRELAAARVCQDIVLKAISIGPLSRNVTIKGGVVMQSLTNDIRRATRDIGVHKHLELEQEEHCFDVCMDENGASLLKNSKEQSIAEKLRALLIFGSNDKRYKDIYDIYYFRDSLNVEKLKHSIKVLIFDDGAMRENTMEDIVRRVESAFKDKRYLEQIASSRQRWIDEDVEEITAGIVGFLRGCA